MLVAKLKSAGITTVVMFTDNNMTAATTKAATANEFSPEWIETGYTYQDFDGFARTVRPGPVEASRLGLGNLFPPFSTTATRQVGDPPDLAQLVLGSGPRHVDGLACRSGRVARLRPLRRGPDLTGQDVPAGAVLDPGDRRRRRRRPAELPERLRANGRSARTTSTPTRTDYNLTWWNPDLSGVSNVGEHPGQGQAHVPGRREALRRRRRGRRSRSAGSSTPPRPSASSTHRRTSSRPCAPGARARAVRHAGRIDLGRSARGTGAYVARRRGTPRAQSETSLGTSASLQFLGHRRRGGELRRIELPRPSSRSRGASSPAAVRAGWRKPADVAAAEPEGAAPRPLRRSTTRHAPGWRRRPPRGRRVFRPGEDTTPTPPAARTDAPRHRVAVLRIHTQLVDPGQSRSSTGKSILPWIASTTRPAGAPCSRPTSRRSTRSRRAGRRPCACRTSARRAQQLDRGCDDTLRATPDRRVGSAHVRGKATTGSSRRSR